MSFEYLVMSLGDEMELQIKDQNNLPSSIVFKTVEAQKLHSLFLEYESKKVDIKLVSGLMTDYYSESVLTYFIDGNETGRGNFYSKYAVSRFFELDGAQKALDADFWKKAIELSGVVDLMPQKRRNEWFDNIKKLNTPAFEKEAVLSTIETLMNNRMKYTAERVDGIFRRLSSEHVTNSPWGFRKKMIVACAMDDYGFVSSTTSGYINDLRDIIGMVTGRGGHINHRSTYCILDKLNDDGKWGKWCSLDGGALRLKLYKKGTVHIEIHEEIALHLNEILAYLYPQAIPEKHRPGKKAIFDTKIKPVEEALPFDVISIIEQARTNGHYIKELDVDLRKKVVDVFEYVGAVVENNRIKFDYDPADVFDHLILYGTIPEIKSHQYYPTPEVISQAVYDMSEIEDHHKCLEPSAGIGHLAEHLQKENTDCVEISKLHAKILKSKGYSVFNDDFLAWANKQTVRYDRVIMNPPYSKGEAEKHFITAANLLKKDGVLVAVMPGSFYKKTIVQGFEHEWSGWIQAISAIDSPV